MLLIREDGPAAKPWLTVIIDDYSRAVAGYFLHFEAPSALQTALALRQAVWRKGDARWHVCGIPDVFYTDNGSDFTSRHMEQVAADLRMRLVFSTPGRPRGRGRIERFFSTLNSMFLPGLPGHAPPGGGVQGRPALTLPELDPLLGEFILGTYHRREHGETGAAPWERWEAGGFLPRLAESAERLDLLLLTVARPRKVHPDGIRFQGLRYVDTTLAAYVGESVTLRYDPRDVAEVRLFHDDGRGERFLCRAVCPEVAGETVPLRDVVRARNRRRRELRATLADRRKTVDALLDLKRCGEQAAPGPPPQSGSPPQAGPHSPEPQEDREGEDRAAPVLRRYLNE